MNVIKRTIVSLMIFFAAGADIVLINFYADWCRFSQMLKPVFDKAADVLQTEEPVGCFVPVTYITCTLLFNPLSP